MHLDETVSARAEAASVELSQDAARRSAVQRRDGSLLRKRFPGPERRRMPCCVRWLEFAWPRDPVEERSAVRLLHRGGQHVVVHLLNGSCLVEAAGIDCGKTRIIDELFGE